ncbi:MAG: chitobiase/beta-hexosaminidase C-terminal domain-containing protein, partial [Paramuribaculum sp.]|nr:chitobiase/beta-hexosaminidase C-terminal domain-containing protein [Paramuribaculum sp.]
TSADVRLFSSETAQDAYTVYYTTDGTDPLTSETVEIYENGKPFKVSASTTIKAFVVAKGHPNSEVVEFNLTRLASDRRYIVDFVNNTAAETPYRVTATAKVVAKGGEYAFVRGTQGHYLPIHFEDADAKAEAAKLNVGDYINDFVAEPYMVKGDVVRGAHVHGEYAALFKGAVAKPENIDEITAEPDVVDNITAANARRYVKIMNVSLEGEAFEDEEISAVASTQWTCITEKGEGQKIEINHTVLEPSFDWDSSDNDPAACYNITGFAMIGDDGDIELWPTEVEKVKTSVRVTASFTGGGLDKQPVIDADNAYTVNFKKHVTVRLNAVAGATIYYYVSDTDDAVNNPAANAKWNVYAQPFTIARNCYIHAYSVAPGYEESAHTHIYMTLVEDAEEPTTPVTPDPAKMSGKLVISHTFNENNIPVVTIAPEDKTLAAGTYDIYYTTDGTTPTVDAKYLYKGPFEFPEGGVVLAILKEAAKELPGEVAHLNVWYVPTGIDGIDSDRTDSDAVRAEGGNIIAPEGSEVYDLTGRRVNPTGLRRGIYIVRVPGAEKAVKIKVD